MSTPMIFTTCPAPRRRHTRPADDLFFRVNALSNPYGLAPLVDVVDDSQPQWDSAREPNHTHPAESHSLSRS